MSAEELTSWNLIQIWGSPTTSEKIDIKINYYYFGKVKYKENNPMLMKYPIEQLCMKIYWLEPETTTTRNWHAAPITAKSN